MIFFDVYVGVLEKFLPFGFSILILSLIHLFAALFYVKENHLENYIFILMSCTYGTVMGGIVGYSESKDVGALIGSVTTFLSFFLGYLSSQNKNTKIKKLIPLSLMAINLSLIFAIFISMEQRDYVDETPRGIKNEMIKQEN